MQLDKTAIVIRERDLLDLLDLALHVVRAHAMPLLVTTLAGAIPFALFNYWLLSDLPLAEDGDAEFYCWRMVMLVLFELPLASTFSTLYLGQMMFSSEFDYPRILRQAVQSLPQLFWYQVVLRGIFMPQALLWGVVAQPMIPLLALGMLLWFIPFTMWPYLNETILLERNPLTSKPGSLSTWRRSKVLHARASGDLFGRLLAAALISGILIVGVWLTLWGVRGFLQHEYVFDNWMFTVLWPIALWTVAAYFSVVRFLSYLDLRIRREGWEVEIILRAEADRLARHIS
ncbi:MAG: hypothetical protein SGJ20_16270 [Planctomycetota bacterium]|nr:hypothetical protein [Planctomycetota bacterium]